MADKRAIREFPAGREMWKKVDAWAAAQGYRVVEESGDHRLYRKGAGFLTGARLVDIRKSGRQVHLEAWVAGNLPARIFSLFILPAEITIESGGAKAVVPRKQGRGEVNALLEQFQQEPIG